MTQSNRTGRPIPDEIVIIGNTDGDADWIKTPENRASEARIHDELSRKPHNVRKQP